MSRRTPLVLIAVLVVLASCSSSSEDADGRSDSADDTPIDAGDIATDAPIDPAWEVELQPIGQPVVVGDVAAVLVRVPGDELDIVGLDLGTGGQRWRHPWSPGLIPTGYFLRPIVVGSTGGIDYIVFQRPERASAIQTFTRRPSQVGDWMHPLVAIDPASGQIIHQTDPMLVFERLGLCFDGFDACGGMSSGDLNDAHGRFDLEAGVVRFDAIGMPPGARIIAEDGLYSTDDRPDEALGRIAATGPLWERAVSELFGPSVTSDSGWSLSHDRERGVFFGYLGWEFDPDFSDRYSAGEIVSFDLGETATAVFDADRGEPLWRADGLEFECVHQGQELPVVVGCRTTGEIRHHLDWDEAEIDIRASELQGLDKLTGDVTWSVPLSESGALGLLRREVGPVTPDALIIETEAGLQRVSFADGDVVDVAVDDIFLCEDREFFFTYAVPYNGDTERRGGVMRYPCTADGVATDEPLTERAIELAADDDGDWFVYATDHSVSGFHRG